MTGRGPSGRVVPTPLEVLRALPRVGLHLLLPAMVVGAFGGSLLDLLLGWDRLATLCGIVVGPVAFAIAINVLERLDDAHTDKMVALAEAYRRDETEKRRAAADKRGELMKFDDFRGKRR
ncbi:hypothetical protein [Jannaschia sp. 2305UL9-9]|uniref:hypothetical protein n=1 Tax=Jannaschia sp. 2305UL9-9 TaxID=3121638 RepID=UPI0035284FB0